MTKGHLVLARGVHERIEIGPDITVEVTGFFRGKQLVDLGSVQVRLRISAPKDVRITRGPALGESVDLRYGEPGIPRGDRQNG
jgi:sRNA-binding carbon storage regulator CsrA